jgi:iron complex outermembrane receptor protein
MRSRILLVFLPLILASQSPYAQSTQEAAPVLEQITVTAQRVEQNLQTTPVAVTALTSDFLETFDLQRVTSLDSAAPNLTFTSGNGGSSSQVSAFIRGVGEFDFLLTTDPAVGLYVDGVFLSRTFGTNLELADIERVEVLRGPQGTLFGKNNIGGAINITTRRPTGSGLVRMEASAGNYDSYEMSAYGDLPLGDDLALGISVLGRRSDGWQERPGGHNGGKQERFGTRATLAWTPTEQFDSRLSVEYTAQAQPSSANVMIAYDPSVATVPFLPLFNAFVEPANPCCTPPTDRDRSNARGPLIRDDLHGYGTSWTNTWKLAGDATLKSITAYRDMHAVFGRDGDNSSVNYNGDVHDENHTQLSQELQMSGGGEPFQWVVGAYYLRERTHDQTQLVTAQGLFDALSALPPTVPLYAFRYALDFNLDFDNHQRTEDYAAYANGEYWFTDKLSLQAGLRYTDETKKFSQDVVRSDSGKSLFLPIDPITGAVDTSTVATPSQACSDVQNEGTYFTCRTSSHEVSPRVGLNYRWTDDVFAYAQVSRGFRSGGINGRPTQLSLIQDYKPEHLTSSEIGLKTTLAEQRLRLNTAVFHNEYDDIQVLLSSGTTVVIANAARATIYGIEADLEALLTDRWTLSGSVGYAHNEFDQWRDGANDYSWRKLRSAPEWTGNLASAYEWPLANQSHLRLAANVSYQSSMFLDGENSALLQAPSRTLVDASVFYVLGDERWEIGVRGRNLTDERVLNAGFNGLQFFGYAEGYYNPPRQYWVTFRYRTQ